MASSSEKLRYRGRIVDLKFDTGRLATLSSQLPMVNLLPFRVTDDERPLARVHPKEIPAGLRYASNPDSTYSVLPSDTDPVSEKFIAECRRRASVATEGGIAD